MMDWKQKMTEGMRLISEACNANDEWDKCKECPFDAYCTALMDENLIDPFEGSIWELDSDSK